MKTGLLAIGALLALAGGASAAFPGENGRLAFQLLSEPGPRLVTIEPSGKRQRLLIGPAMAPASPAWSPDGGRIAFAGLFGTEAERRAAVFVADADGSGVYRLTSPPVGISDADPAWSPDGRSIVFARLFPSPIVSIPPPRAFGPQLYVVRTNGKGLRLVARAGRWPAWSSDGSLIAYVVVRDVGPTSFRALAVIRSDGTGGRQLAQLEAQDLGSPDWSPGGRWIAYAEAGRIVLLRRDGSARRPLTEGLFPDSEPAWSPDGERIAFVRNFLTRGAPARRLMVMSRDGGGQRPLAPSRFEQTGPDWQPLP